MNPYKYVRKWVHKHILRHKQHPFYAELLDWECTECSCGGWFA